jgi:hypothetical protein
MLPSLTPTYTPPITTRYGLQAGARRSILPSNDICYRLWSPDRLQAASLTSRCASEFTYDTYIELHLHCLHANRLPKAVKMHLSHSQPIHRSYPPSTSWFSPTRSQNHAVANQYPPTSGVAQVSFTHLQPLTSTYDPSPPATHALTPLFKGVSARGVANGTTS